MGKIAIDCILLYIFLYINITRAHINDSSISLRSLFLFLKILHSCEEFWLFNETLGEKFSVTCFILFLLIYKLLWMLKKNATTYIQKQSVIVEIQANAF